MIKPLSIFVTLSLSLQGLSAQEAQEKTEFVPLFNGSDLDGWFGRSTDDPAALKTLSEEELAAHKESTLADIQSHWSVSDGVLINDGKGLYLTTDQDYRDFELQLEYKTVALADSGVYLRGIPQVQIWDPTEEKKFRHGADKGSGGLWNNRSGTAGKDPSRLMDRPFGEWNQMHIQMIGERVSVSLNGEQVVDEAVFENYFTKKKKNYPYSVRPAYATGPIQLQTHGGEISWRDVEIREIGSDEANQHLQDRAGDGFESVFDGTSLEGWIGATENYHVVDGNIVCKRGKGGNLLWGETFENAHYRFEFRLPPGGNNGIGLRLPSAKCAPHRDGLEIQVLDHDHPKYKNLKAYQFHGSVYELAPAHPGYLRPTWEWNYQEIIYTGSQITVILNGTTILDVDLGGIEAPDHLGKLRTSGYFGFVGHNDPVEFRNVAVKILP